MIISNLFWVVPIASLIALGFAYYFFKQMMKEDEGTDTMKRLRFTFVRALCLT